MSEEMIKGPNEASPEEHENSVSSLSEASLLEHKMSVSSPEQRKMSVSSTDEASPGKRKMSVSTDDTVSSTYGISPRQHMMSVSSPREESPVQRKMSVSSTNEASPEQRKMSVSSINEESSEQPMPWVSEASPLECNESVSLPSEAAPHQHKKSVSSPSEAAPLEGKESLSSPSEAALHQRRKADDLPGKGSLKISIGSPREASPHQRNISIGSPSESPSEASPHQRKISIGSSREASPHQRKISIGSPRKASASPHQRKISIGSPRKASVSPHQRKISIGSPRSPRRRCLSPPPYPGAKPITAGMYLEPHHLVGKIYWQHHIIQIPLYFIKWILSQLLAMYSVIFWRTPMNDDEIVRIFEETSLVIILRRDHEAEKAEVEAFRTFKGCTTEDIQSLLETRHYYIDVKRCDLELVVREKATITRNGKSVVGESTPLKSLSARYTKTRRRVGCGGGIPGKKRAGDGGEGTTDGKWTSHILSFVANGKTIYEREKMFAFLNQYNSFSSHTKSHLMGNGLADRILLDDRVTDTLAESTWSTTALHYGLLYGTQGPLTYSRTSANAWMGIGAIPTRDSLVKESENMSALGAGHSDKQRWAKLELPFPDFLLGARLVLTRAMKKNAIPPDLHEAIFLSCIMHATDHVMHNRVFWGKVFSFNPNGKPGNWYDHYESTAWRYMWVKPTLNPIWNNKIRNIRKPFYRQLYEGIKEIDTFKVADEITASVMY